MKSKVEYKKIDLPTTWPKELSHSETTSVTSMQTVADSCLLSVKLGHSPVRLATILTSLGWPGAGSQLIGSYCSRVFSECGLCLENCSDIQGSDMPLNGLT